MAEKAGVSQATVSMILNRRSNVSFSAETVEKDISGFTAAEDEKSMLAEIERIFADEEMLARVGEAARKTIPVPWSELMPIVYDKYAELIDRKKIELKIK